MYIPRYIRTHVSWLSLRNRAASFAAVFFVGDGQIIYFGKSVDRMMTREPDFESSTFAAVGFIIYLKLMVQVCSAGSKVLLSLEHLTCNCRRRQNKNSRAVDSVSCMRSCVAFQCRTSRLNIFFIILIRLRHVC